MPYEDEDPPYVEPDEELDELAHGVIGAAIEVHKKLGAGLEESFYQNALVIERRHRNIPFVQQAIVEVEYRGEKIGERRIDLIVGGKLVAELKAIETLTSLHRAQVRTYLKITHLRLGLLINFNIELLKDGVKRVINPSAF